MCVIARSEKRRCGSSLSDDPSAARALASASCPLIAFNPGVFAAEQARGRKPFEAAVEMAEQVFATEFQRLTAHPAEQLTGLQDGEPKVFRDTAITTFTEFFDRFRTLNVCSNPELDTPVDQARQVIAGIEPQQLRDSVRPRAMVANDVTRMGQAPSQSAPAEHPSSRADGSGGKSTPTEMELVVGKDGGTMGVYE